MYYWNILTEQQNFLVYFWNNLLYVISHFFFFHSLKFFLFVPHIIVFYFSINLHFFLYAHLFFIIESNVSFAIDLNK